MTAAAHEIAERRRGGAVDSHLDVVHRARDLALGVEPASVVGLVSRRVPAHEREIESSDERNLVVDDDDFLMVRGPDRMLAVEGEVQASMASPAELDRR